MPNLLIYDAKLTLSQPAPLFLAIAMILEARRNVGIIEIWPKEMDYLTYGYKLTEQKNVIIKFLEEVQISLYGEIKNNQINKNSI